MIKVLLKHRFLLLLLTLCVVLFIFLLISVFFQHNSLRNQFLPIVPTPTITYATPLTISSTIPSNNSVSKGLLPTISVSFSRPLTPDEENSVQATIQPSIPITSTFSTDNQTFLATPTAVMISSSNYSVTIRFGSKSLAWQFTTPKLSDLSPEEGRQVQSIWDHNYATYRSQIFQKYPWYTNLPVSAPDYFTYFNPDTETFISQIYINNNSPLGKNQQVEKIKQEVLLRLQGLGVQAGKYSYQWTLVSS